MPHIEQCFNLVDWQVDPALNRVIIDNQSYDLEPRVMQVLVCLYNHAEELVTKDDLLDEVWHGVSITDDAIYCSISKLRKTFRQVEEYRSPQLKTISRQGYMLSLNPEDQFLKHEFYKNGYQYGRRHDDKLAAQTCSINGKEHSTFKLTKPLKKSKRLANHSELKPIKLKFFVDSQKTEELPEARSAKKKLKLVLLILLSVLFLQSLYIAIM